MPNLERSSVAFMEPFGTPPPALCLRSAPDLAGYLDNLGELRPLGLLGENIALLGRGEAALRADAQALQTDIFRCLVDAPLDIVLGFQRAGFRRDQA